MSHKNDGGPAFPVWELNGQGKPEMTDFGMTRRDYFAAKAMQAMLARGYEVDMRGYEGWMEEFGREAYRFADAMLAASQRKEPQP